MIRGPERELDREGVLRVFVSSTSKDLFEHRRKAIETLDGLGMKPEHMETFESLPGHSLEECLDRVRGCDVLVVFVAHRLGWVPGVDVGGDGETSITEHEVAAARQNGIDVLPFLVEPTHPWAAGRESDELETCPTDEAANLLRKRVQRLKKFKEELARSPCSFFTTADVLATKVSTSVANWERRLSRLQRPQQARAAGPSEIIDFSTERSRHEDFFGREDVFAEFDRILAQPGFDRGWILLTGGPGSGKSAILDRFLARLERERPVPHHFLRRGRDWAKPDVVARALAARVEALHPTLAQPDDASPAQLFRLLDRVSKEVLIPKGQRLVLVVDGLDEAEAERDGENPLPRFLPDVLPQGVVIVASSRKTYPGLPWLKARQRVREIDLDAPAWLRSNREACLRFWKHHAPRFSPPLDPDFIARAVDAAEGNLLHAVKLREWLEALPSTERRVDRIPRGLEALLEESWSEVQRGAGDEFGMVQQGLTLLCVARDALTLPTIARVLGWDGVREQDAFLRRTRPFLLEENRLSREAGYRLYHESFREFLESKLGRDRLRAMHLIVIETIASWPPAARPGSPEADYAVGFALHHRVEADDWPAARALATDIDYLEARVKELGVSALEDDMRAADSRWMQGEAGQEDLRILQRAVRRVSHWLRLDPSALASLLHTQLTMLGWPPARIEELLRTRSSNLVLRVRLPPQAQGMETRTLRGHESEVSACAISADGKRTLSGSTDKTLKLWDLESGEELATLRGHESGVSACAISPDGKRALSGSGDMTLKLWDLESREELATLRGHEDWVSACAISPDGKRALSGSWDKTLKLWDLESREHLATLRGHGDPVYACAISPDAKRALSGSGDKTLKLWDLESREELATLRGHDHLVRACAISPDGKRALSGSHDRTLKLWDLESRVELATLRGHESGVSACAISPDGKRALSGSTDKTLKLWDLENGEDLAALRGHEVWVSACAISADGKRALSGSTDKTLKLWNLESGEDVATLRGHEDLVTACAINPDGTRALSGSSDMTLKLWDLESREELATLRGHESEVTACAISADGKRALSSSTDKTLKLWDLESREELATLRGHEDLVSACAISPDGKRALSGSYDRTLKLWDLESREELATLRGHEDWVSACAISPDGKRALSGSGDKTLKLWDLESAQATTTHYGVAAFGCLALCMPHLIAGDALGNVWMLEVRLPSSSEPTSRSKKRHGR